MIDGRMSLENWLRTIEKVKIRRENSIGIEKAGNMLMFANFLRKTK